MKLLKKAFLTLITLAFFNVTMAQTPSFYKLGEEELSGIDIYDILQDKNQNYWLATDNGIIKYDGYSFKKIPSKNALSNSVFDLKLDYLNNLYCKNLSGQIFQISNDSSKVYFQIPDSLMSTDINYAFNNLNELTIATNSIFTVNKKKEIKFIFNENNWQNHFYQFLTLRDSSIFTHNNSQSQIIELSNDSYRKIPVDSFGLEYNIQGFYLNDQLIYFDKGSGEILNRNNNTFEINNNFSLIHNKSESHRYYSDNNNLWIPKLSGGVKIFNKHLKALFNNNVIFKNNIISSFCKDSEGNTILGTFGEGLIIIPNINLVDIKIPNENVKFTRVTSTPENAIFFGSQDGRIFKKEKNQLLEVFRESAGKHVDILHYIDKSKELLIVEKVPILINLASKKEFKKLIEAIKDITKISDSLYLIASNVGVYYYNLKNKTLERDPYLKKFRVRTNCVSFDPNTESIYAGTSQGLKIGNENNVTYFKLNGSSIICRDILYFDGKIYVTTRKNGVLIFENDQLIENWTTKNQLISNNTKDLKVYKNKLFLSSSMGIQVLDKKGKNLYTLNKSDGLYANTIIDFEIRNDVLWLVHQKGVQTITINSFLHFNYTPTITLEQILINDSISPTKNNTFTYQQNKFEFYVSTNSLKYQNEIYYHHQLVGIDNDWQTNTYFNNKIEYKSLPPGNYTFKVKAICRNKESEIVFYTFEITPPFWSTWWFYLFVLVVFITIGYLIFNREVKKQRKKIQLENELNASKLIAIQSQMNPHFIFNSINSIQDLILKGDIDNSYSYIIKFSKLVRQTLNFSDKEFIDIEDEIELLKVYLELEKLRFKNDFEYTITCKVEDTQVPPMLIQPFVENAIKHGLLHKEGMKNLDIIFKIDKTLICIVTDNGIGRKKAQEIKARQGKNHQSFSVNATKSRFKIMQSHYKQRLGISFEDLKLNDESIGTKVIIKMPFKQNY